MRILLILAHHGIKKKSLFYKFVYTSYYPSLTLDQLAAITPADYDLEIIDERWQNINYGWDGDLVGISSLTYSAQHAYEIADRFRSKGKTVVLGGYHPSSLPQEAKKHADSVVVGEAEESWPKLLEDFEQSRLKSFYHSKPVNPEKIPSCERISTRFQGVASIQATRGCPYECKFCAIQKVEGSTLRMRPIVEVIKEIKSIRSKRLFFADSSLTINPEYTKTLFKKMKGLKKTFSCYGNINVLGNDKEILELANEAGCELWLIGFESINQETLHAIGKQTNKVDEYANTVRKIRNHGMRIMGLFMFGFDTDMPEVFDTTIQAIYRWKLDKAGFAILTPFPGTKLYSELEKEGRILTKDWSKYNLKDVVFQPKNMTKEELYEGTKRLVNEFYSTTNSLKRSFRDDHITPHRFVYSVTSDYSAKKLYNVFGL